jgi:hypothetical protein
MNIEITNAIFSSSDTWMVVILSLIGIGCIGGCFVLCVCSLYYVCKREGNAIVGDPELEQKLSVQMVEQGIDAQMLEPEIDGTLRSIQIS